MGLDTTTTHLVWFVAIVATVGSVAHALMATAEGYAEGRAAQDERYHEKLATSIGAAFFCYNEDLQRLNTTVRNHGATLDASALTVVADGQVLTQLDARVWGSVGTTLWRQGETATLNKTPISPSPSRVMVYAENGAATLATGIVCPELSYIVVTPSSASLQPGGSVEVSAAAFDQLGNHLPGYEFSWTTTTGAVTSINATRALLVAGTTAGEFQVATTIEGVTGAATITIHPGPPTSLDVTPSSAQVVAGSSQAFNATVLDAWGNGNYSEPVSWTTNAGSIGVDGVLDASTSAQSGRSVTATRGALSDSAAVDVVPDALDHVTVTPASVSLLPTSGASFSTQGYDQHGNAISGLSYAWSAARGAVTSGGEYTAPTASGADTVTATASGVSGAASVTVRVGPPASVSVSPDPASVAAGATQAFTATVRDAWGNVNSTAPVAWSTTAGSITSGGVLTASTTAASGRSVTATSESVPGSATVNVVPGPLSSIVVTPSSATVLTTSVTTFSAQGYDAHGNAISGLTYAWSSTAGSVTSAGVFTAPAATGSVTVTATSGGVSGTSAVTVQRNIHVETLGTFKAGAASTTFAFTDVVETRVTVRDHNGTAVSGATIRLVLTDANGAQVYNQTASTNAGGFASFNYTIPNGAKKGQWKDEVMTLSGTNMVYDPAANVVRLVNFNVT